uniref:EF-hand domain-containing protein n=1 Tax=Zooxanthella nutricula TaxID=1333877 RepID=A0A7S2H7K4_9DINO
MEIKLAPGAELNRDQKEAMQRGFDYVVAHADGARQRAREGLPLLLLPGDAPRLLRACGRAITQQEVRLVTSEVPPQGIDFNGFCKLFERLSKQQQATEGKLCEALGALDITGTGALDPTLLRDLLRGFGEGMLPADIEAVLSGLPKDRMGKISTRSIARRLVRGPEGLQYLS